MEGPGSPNRADIEGQVGRILASPQFRASRRRCELLRWSVGRVLAGEPQPVKEYHIAQEVFGKPESWDARLDSSVRVEFNRMRQKLREYYAGEGAGDPVLIEFPFRGYLPQVSLRAIGEQPSAAAAPAAESRAARFTPGRAALAIAAGLALIGAAVWGQFPFFRPLPPVTTVAVLPLPPGVASPDRISFLPPSPSYTRRTLPDPHPFRDGGRRGCSKREPEREGGVLNA